MAKTKPEVSDQKGSEVSKPMPPEIRKMIDDAAAEQAAAEKIKAKLICPICGGDTCNVEVIRDNGSTVVIQYRCRVMGGSGRVQRKAEEDHADQARPQEVA